MEDIREIIREFKKWSDNISVKEIEEFLKRAGIHNDECELSKRYGGKN